MGQKMTTGRIGSHLENKNSCSKLSKLFKYIKFLLSSTNQYGVHSPFIYNYLTKCLYRNSRFKTRKTEKILFKSIVYFDIGHIWAPPHRKSLITRLKKAFPQVQFDDGPYDLAIMSVCDFNETIKYLSGSIHNDTVLIIDDIHKNNCTENHWEELKKRERVTVTLDMFYCGVVFFRKEQAKEHFKIRI